MIQRVCALHGHGDHITFDTAFASPPLIVTSAQYGRVLKIAYALNNAATGFDLALKDNAGNTVSNAWVQWIAIGLAQ
jgi:hypothetical protein